LGFPDTQARFNMFAEILRSTEHRSGKTFLVLDDFHLIHTGQALTFAERCAHLQIPGACVVLISRKEPEINAVSLFAKGSATIITEDELRFTEDETAEFFKSCGIEYMPQDIPLVMKASKGWPMALKLLSMTLKKIPYNLTHALDIMKQNIFKLLEAEAFADLPEKTRKFLVQFSLLADLPLTPLHEFSGDDTFLQNIPQLAPFMWYDSFIGDYRVHPLYIEFLQSKHDILTDDEKQSAYRWAAAWCIENNYVMDAVNYCAKSRQYECMIKILLSQPYRLPPDTCKYYLDIINNMDESMADKNNESFLFLKNYYVPSLLTGLEKYSEAKEICLHVIRKWENEESVFSRILLSAVYSKLTYISLYTCTTTHIYDFPAYLKKSADYYQLSSAPAMEISGPSAVADIRSFACLVGEGADLAEFDQFIAAAREAYRYLPGTFHSMYYGYEDWAACEIAYYKNQLAEAGNYAHSAIVKAREKKQHSIEAAAQHYLLRMAIHEGDYALVNEMLKQSREHLDNPDFWNRYLLHDLFTGSFYVLIEYPELVPSWIAAGDDSDNTPAVHIPIRGLIIGIRYYIASKKYKQALAVLSKSYPREPQRRFYFGELILTLLLAVVKIKTGDIAGALTDFEKAYRISFNGLFEMPFIEIGNNMRPLAAAALHSDCGIPGEWLHMIDRKASIYAKKVAVIRNAVKKERKVTDTVQLSNREQEVLNDLYLGLSREEIAANRYLSVNTVKKILQSIYFKLDANNSRDAIRIAVEKKLVG
jgi:LuxR family maltose regulon positive regulatory protein